MVLLEQEYLGPGRVGKTDWIGLPGVSWRCGGIGFQANASE
jgi:hypothetical protein